MTDPHYDPDTHWCTCECSICSPVGCSRENEPTRPDGNGCDNYLADGTPKKAVYTTTDTTGGRA